MSERRYQCPACGSSETIVWCTRAFSDLILRSRKCLVCGYIHKTIETRLDSEETWKSIKNIISDAKSTILS